MRLIRKLRQLAASQWTRAVLFWSALLALALTAAQIAMPEYRYRLPRAAYEDCRKFYLDIFEPLFVRSEDGRLRPAAQNVSPASFSAQKPQNTWRAFIVGGSAAQNMTADRHIAVFENRLQSETGERTEIINAAVAGYDSFRALNAAREIMRYSPDCLIVMSGNNEAFYPQRLNAALYCFAKLSRVKLFRFLLRPAAAHAEIRTYTRKMCDFEDNLVKTARLAKAGGAKVALCTLPVNRADFAPAGEFPADARYVAAAVSCWRGDLERAEREIKRYIRLNPSDAQGYFRLARILEASGRRRQAGIFFGRVTDMRTGGKVYATDAVNALIRKTAAAQRTGLADMAAVFDRIWIEGPPPDRPLFVDECHPSGSYGATLFNSLLRALAPGAETISPEPVAAPTPGPARNWLFRFARESLSAPSCFLRPDMFCFFQKAAGFCGPGKAIAIIEGREMESLLGADRAGSKWQCFYAHTGEALRRMGEKAHARRFLKRAQESGLGAWPLFLSLSLLEHDAGDETEARRYMRKALKATDDVRARNTIAAFRQCLRASRKKNA